MKDSDLISDIIGTMTKHGYNCDRGNLNHRVFMVLSDLQEANERMEGILKLCDMSLPPPAIQDALIALDS